MIQPITSFSEEHGFLSNFFPVPHGIPVICGCTPPITVAPTVEHAFQSLKTENVDECLAILLAPTPGKAKRLGQRCTLRPDWNLMRIAVMQKLLADKFSFTELGERLLATGDAELIEGNTWGDTFWGCVQIDGAWVGENNLGKLLMELREKLRNEGG